MAPCQPAAPVLKAAAVAPRDTGYSEFAAHHWPTNKDAPGGEVAGGLTPAGGSWRWWKPSRRGSAAINHRIAATACGAQPFAAGAAFATIAGEIRRQNGLETKSNAAAK